MAMINTKSLTPTVVQISKAQALALAAVNLDGILSHIMKGHDDNVSCSPSMVPTSRNTAATCMGASVSAESFCTGLLYLTAAYANGQGKLNDLAEGLPPVARHAFMKATYNLQRGKGCTVASLKTAVAAGVTAAAALPIRQKAAKLQENAVIEGESKRVIEAMPEPGYSWADSCHEYKGGFDFGHSGAIARMLADAANKRILASEQKAVETSTASAGVAIPHGMLLCDLFKQGFDRDHTDAIKQLRAMAELAGFELTAKPTEKTA